MSLLREPLVHFLLLGAVLFGAFELWGSRAAGGRADQIVVSPGMVENLRLSYERNTGRPPSAAELDTAIAEFVREEVLTREAIALGLHLDDPIVRRQLRQRMEFLQSDDANIGPPGDAELQQFLDENADRFRKGEAAGVPALADVRPAVERAWYSARRQAALDAAYDTLRRKYDVVIEKPDAPPPEPEAQP